MLPGLKNRTSTGFYCFQRECVRQFIHISNFDLQLKFQLKSKFLTGFLTINNKKKEARKIAELIYSIRFLSKLIDLK